MFADSSQGPTKPPSPKFYLTDEAYREDMRNERNKRLQRPLKKIKDGLKTFAKLFEQPREPENFEAVLPKSVAPTARLPIVKAVHLRRESRRLSDAGVLGPISKPPADMRKRDKPRGATGSYGEARKRKRKRTNSGPSNIGDGVGIKVYCYPVRPTCKC